jgi:hypothetical protein
VQSYTVRSAVRCSLSLRSVELTDAVAASTHGGLTRARVTAGKARLKVDLAALLLKHVRHLTLAIALCLELTPTVPHRIAVAGKARLGLTVQINANRAAPTKCTKAAPKAAPLPPADAVVPSVCALLERAVRLAERAPTPAAARAAGTHPVAGGIDRLIPVPFAFANAPCVH